MQNGETALDIANHEGNGACVPLLQMVRQCVGELVGGFSLHLSRAECVRGRVRLSISVFCEEESNVECQCVCACVREKQRR